jgi:cytochrome c
MKKIIFIYTLLLSTLFANENQLLFYGNCIACHGELGKKVAPHMSEVKGYYLMAYPKKEEFVSHMAQWLFEPNEKTAQHQEAVKKYKLMPYLSIDLDTLTKIATYIYENDDFGVANNLEL